jgi:Short-chain alcohol dehydrogenase of unknown specificity
MASTSQPVAVVTGASSGIGAATARRLATEGFHVVLAARRLERLTSLASDIGGTPVRCDVTVPDDVASLAGVVAALGRPVHVLVNNAGGALGLDPVASSPVEDWQRMYESNVIGALRVSQALLPALEASGHGTVVVLTSTAGHDTYPGGAGYVAAKSAEVALAKTLRLELVGRPVRVIEVAPGMGAYRRVLVGTFRRRRGAGRGRLPGLGGAAWSPRTSRTASRGASPARSTSTSTAWWYARSPRPATPSCTGGRSRPVRPVGPGPAA